MWQTELFGFTVYQLFWYFCIYSVLGWCTEVVFCTVNTGKWVNRGFLNGPVCPIYGFGVLIVLCVLTPLKDNFFILFAGAALLTSLLEFFTGFVLEKAFHTHWWDYSDVPFNIGGYICLKFSLIWGLCCVMVVRVVHPVVADLVALVPPLAGEIIAIPVFIVFVTDLIVTATSIAHFNRDLGELARLTDALHRQSDILSQALGDTSLAVSEKLEGAASLLSDKLEDTKADLTAKAAVAAEETFRRKEELAGKAIAAAEAAARRKDEITEKARAKAAESLRYKQELTARYEALMNKRQHTARRLARAFPDMRHTVYRETFEAMRERMRRK